MLRIHNDSKAFLAAFQSQKYSIGRSIMELNYGSLVIHAPFKANKLTLLGWVVNSLDIYKLRQFCLKKPRNSALIYRDR